jgi:hypothetical protein
MTLGSQNTDVITLPADFAVMAFLSANISETIHCCDWFFVSGVLLQVKPSLVFFIFSRWPKSVRLFGRTAKPIRLKLHCCTCNELYITFGEPNFLENSPSRFANFLNDTRNVARLP